MFCPNWDFTTVLLSLRVSPGERSRLTLLTGMENAIDAFIDKLRYRLQNAPDAPLSADEWEYFAVVAGTAERATPHLHVFVYVEGDVSRSRFEPVVEKWVEKWAYAPDDMTGNSPEGETIVMRGKGDDSIPRMDDEPEESAGATYVLSQLPHLEDVDDMARDELFHAVTLDAWSDKAFRRSEYKVWKDEEPDPEEFDVVEPDYVGTSPENLT